MYFYGYSHIDVLINFFILHRRAESINWKNAFENTKIGAQILVDQLKVQH